MSAHWGKLVVVVGVTIAIVAAYLAFFRGEVRAPSFSTGDTWTWAVVQGSDNENAATFTRTDSVVGKQTKMGRECWIFRSTSADNAKGYSMNFHHVAADGWYGAGSESYSDNLKMGETVPTGPILSVEFPLEVGKKWMDIRVASGYDNARGIGSMDLQMISKGEVRSKGFVTVPAGTFEAYEIEFTMLLSGTGRVTVGGQELTAQISTTITGTRWHSDSVKNFVKEISDSTTMVTILGQTATTRVHGEMELTSHSLGG